MIQLAFDFGEQRRNPFTCQHLLRTAYGIKDGEVLCGFNGSETFTNCHASISGDPPKCVFEPCDNSPESVDRRLAWIREEQATSALQKG